ncbi:MAG: HAMP domain-containing histidine kinase [Desulfocapsa sp.]|nr:HAMP domain-containing histidine kinase [Desulfocapsa sp.]
MKQPEARVPDALRPFSESLQCSMLEQEQIRFDLRRDCLLKAFIDVINNDHSLKYFFQISVTVPLLLGDFHASFYLYEKKTDRFLCVCDSKEGLLESPHPPDFELPPDFRETQTFSGALICPLYPRSGTIRQDLPIGYAGKGMYDPDPFFASNSLLGLYVVSSATPLEAIDKEFFRIITLWIGNRLNNRLIANQYQEHLKFLNELGRDIGHNIIVPNMYLKYLLRQMEKQINALQDVEQNVEAFLNGKMPAKQCENFLGSYREKQEALVRSHQELLKHHNQATLFLESLFREQHFKEGHLVLQPTQCFVERDIILPQLDIYLEKLKRQGTTVDNQKNLYQQKFPLMVDVGLLSQVYANLFSNAVKYAEEIVDHNGKPRKAVAYGAEEVQNFPDLGRQGVKFNVFTTGPVLSEDERHSVFEEGNRAENSRGIEGSGHGLNFVRRVIEVHGGKVGCEATPEGNNFYFILPLPGVEPREDA